MTSLNVFAKYYPKVYRFSINMYNQTMMAHSFGQLSYCLNNLHQYIFAFLKLSDSLNNILLINYDLPSKVFSRTVSRPTYGLQIALECAGFVTNYMFCLTNITDISQDLL